MPFFSDILRPLGVVVAAGLSATGVGIPLALAVGGAVGAGSNAAADAIDRGEAARQADEAAQNAKRAADAENERLAAQQRLELAHAEAEALRVQAHANLPNKLIAALRENNLPSFQETLSQLDDEQFTQLGLRPLTACTNAAMRARVVSLLHAEEDRRHISHPTVLVNANAHIQSARRPNTMRAIRHALGLDNPSLQAAQVIENAPAVNPVEALLQACRQNNMNEFRLSLNELSLEEFNQLVTRAHDACPYSSSRARVDYYLREEAQRRQVNYASPTTRVEDSQESDDEYDAARESTINAFRESLRAQHNQSRRM